MPVKSMDVLPSIDEFLRNLRFDTFFDWRASLSENERIVRPVLGRYQRLVVG